MSDRVVIAARRSVRGNVSHETCGALAAEAAMVGGFRASWKTSAVRYRGDVPDQFDGKGCIP